MEQKTLAIAIGAILAVVLLVVSYFKFLGGGGPSVTPEEGLKIRQQMEAKAGGAVGTSPGAPGKTGMKDMMEQQMGGGRMGAPKMGK